MGSKLLKIGSLVLTGVMMAIPSIVDAIAKEKEKERFDDLVNRVEALETSKKEDA